MDSLVASHYVGEKGREYAYGHQQQILTHMGYRLQSKFFLPFLRTDMQVLDFGCGNGSLAKALQPHVKGIEGLEVNQYARELAIMQGINVYDSITSIPNGKEYDAIISNHVLEHIPDVVTTLRLLRHYLCAGGICVVVVPIEDFRTRRNRHWNPRDKDHHLHTWTPLLFGNTLSEAGFTPRTLDVIASAWTPRLFFLGDTWLQSCASYLVSCCLRRRQLRAVASVACE